MSDFGILSFGAYVPITRLQRSAIHATNQWFAPGLGGLAKGERATANWDEDSITMAVEAARDALEGMDRSAIERVLIASTTLPFADRQNRSEEHTSELQSLMRISYAVFCLKKKKHTH